jgi:hypothetical protein
LQMDLLQVDHISVVEVDIFWVEHALDGIMQGIWRLRDVGRDGHFDLALTGTIESSLWVI